MDEVVALSNALRARHTDGPTHRLDAIPPLTKALSQIHVDSTRLLTARTASSPAPTAVHAPALRLFSTLHFPADRLRRAVHDLDLVSPFVDSPLRHTPPLRHPAWLPPRALDDARLALNAELRARADRAVHSELVAASHALLAVLAPSSAHLQHHHAQSGPRSARSTPQQPQSSSATRRPRLADATPGSSTPGAAAPPPVAATALPAHYVAAVRDVATRGDAPSVASLMHETAQAAADSPHFVHALSVLACAARHAPPDRPPLPDALVWTPRVVLEDLLAARIPGLPPRHRHAQPQAVIPAVEAYVKSILSPARAVPASRAAAAAAAAAAGRHGGHTAAAAVEAAAAAAVASAEDPAKQLRPGVWAYAYYCLRIGAVTAAIYLLRMHGRTAIADHFQLFLKGRSNVLRNATAAMLSSFGTEPGQDELREMPMSPGTLVRADKYDAVVADFRASACTSTDPFMQLCYVLLLRLELQMSTASHADMTNVAVPSVTKDAESMQLAMGNDRFNLLFQSVEDYFWFRLWLCRTPCDRQVVSDLPDSILVTPEEIQQHVRAVGSSHFDSNGAHPLVYALVLVSAAMYEEAMAYLGNHADEHWMHYAVHFGLVLYHLNWLRDENDFHLLLQRYTTLVAKLNPGAAALYLLTLRDKAIVERSLYELIVNTGEYDTLLGRADDTPSGHGAIADIIRHAEVQVPSGFAGDDLRKLRLDAALHGADEAAARSNYAAAASLYLLAERQAECYEMRMRDLADEVDKLSSSRRSLAIARARDAVTACAAAGASSVDPRIVRTLEELLRVARVFEENWTGRLAGAWAALRDVETLPVKDTDITLCHRRLTSEGTIYGSVVRRSVTELLKVSLQIAEYALETGSVRKDQPISDEQTQSGGSDMRGVEDRSPLVSELKRICIFAALLEISDSSLNERVVRIEAYLSNFDRSGV